MGGESPSSSFLPLWFNPIRSVRQSTWGSYASTAIVESLRATLTYSQQHKTTTACPYRNLVLSLRLRAFYKALCVSSHLTFVPPTIGCEGFMISARHAMVTSFPSLDSLPLQGLGSQAEFWMLHLFASSQTSLSLRRMQKSLDFFLEK